MTDKYESGGVMPPHRRMREVVNKCQCGKVWVGMARALCAECLIKEGEKNEQ